MNVGRNTMLTLIIAAGLLVSAYGICYEAADRSDLAGAGLFAVQGAVFILYYIMRNRGPPGKRH